jgi:serine/threonine protein kinase
MIGKTLGDFEIREEIGRGGMGQVYKARQISLDRDVAIKILPGNLSEVEEFRERFDLEAKVVASLIHENILQVYSKGITADGIHYFAMEYVDGENLSDMIKRGGIFSEAETINIVAQACRGLEAAWKKNIIHRDIKPGNIMLTKSGIIKIADFGLARSLDTTKHLTQTNMYLGTVAYTSPEQGEGKPLDQRTDIYSLGIVLYQLLTGSVPFTAETPSAIIYKHVHEAPPAPRTLNPNISPQAEAVVLKAIAKRREDRFQNPVEFREALESTTKAQPQREALDGQKGATAATGLKESPSETGGVASAKSRRTVPLILAAIAILLLGGSTLYASKYGYQALLSKVWPLAAREEKKDKTVLPKSGEASVATTLEVSAVKPEFPGPTDKNVATTLKTVGPPPSVGPANKDVGNALNTVSSPPPAPSRKEEEPARGVAGPAPIPPPETRSAPAEQAVASRRGPMPFVLVVISGEQNVSDMIESSISRKLQDGSIPLSTAGEIQALAERYGGHAIPLNALDQQHLRADVLVYVSVNTVNAAPLKFYGRTMEQYASTISIKVIDTATKKVIHSPRSKTVHYTTLNMQDNIEAATEEMISDLPQRLGVFWKG